MQRFDRLRLFRRTAPAVPAETPPVQFSSPETGDLSCPSDGGDVWAETVGICSASHVRGTVDCPTDGGAVDGNVLEVRGWCLFNRSRVARVDVVVDGRNVGLARLYVERPDIGGQSDHPDASVAGFEMLVNVDWRHGGSESLVTVEAISLDGRRWRSRTHLVRWAADVSPDARSAELSADLLARRSLATLDRLPSGGSRVLIFTHDLSYGGGQLWLLELIRQLDSFADLDCMVASVADGPLRGTLEDLGVDVHVTAPWRLDEVQAYEGRIHELAVLIRASGAGVVLVNTLGVFPAVDAATRAGVPSIWAIHESFDPAVYRYICWGPTGMHPHVQSRFDACFQEARGLIFEARQTAELFAHLCSPDRRFIVDYGVDIDEIDAYRASVDRSALRSSLGFDEDSVVVLVVGVFEPRKAQAAVVAAFDELAVVHDSLRLVLVGCHPCAYSTGVREQLARCAAGDRVDLVPITPDIYPWYESADVLLCASDVESVPRSILEAMAFELAVVSTDVSGIADLIDDGRTGWLTRSRDLEGMVGLLHLVLRMSAERRREVGAQARVEALRRHGDNRYGRIFARVLTSLLSDPSCELGAVFSHARAEREEIMR